MKVLESLSNLFRKRAPAVAEAVDGGTKKPVRISRNTTIWVVSTSLLLAVAVGAGAWWWKARHKAAVPIAVAHVPAKAIVNAPPAPPVVESLPVPEDVAAQPHGVLEATSAVSVSMPPAESAGHGVVSQEIAVAAAPDITTMHEAKAKPAYVAAPLPVALDVPSPPKSAEKKKVRIHTARQQQKTHAESKTAVADQAAAGLVTTDPVSSMDKRVQPITVRQQADIDFRKGVGHMQQGHINDALAAFEACLKLDSLHDAARQAMVALLLEGKRTGDAERVLQEGVKANPRQSAFAMLLARLQIERGAPWSALLTLQDSLPHAKQQADYQAFMAALLQRLEHHQEAVAHYQAALRITPNSGLWLMGLGLSLQSLQRTDEARDAFQRAKETYSLNADLQDFVAQRLKEL